jgi:hypothetical protein
MALCQEEDLASRGTGNRAQAVDTQERTILAITGAREVRTATIVATPLKREEIYPSEYSTNEQRGSQRGNRSMARWEGIRQNDLQSPLEVKAQGWRERIQNHLESLNND